MGPQSQRHSYPGGLRAQVLLGLSVLLLLAFTLVALVFVGVTKRELQQVSKEQAFQLADTLAILDGADPFVLGSFQHASGLAMVALLTPDKQDFFSGDPKLAGAVLERRGEFFTQERVHRVVTVAGAPYAMAGVPSPGGIAIVGVPLAPIQERLDDAQAMLTLYLFLDTLFILIVGYAFFTFLVVRPIRAIGVATERAAQGDLASPITVLPRNELGQVGHRFNLMLGQIEQHRTVLQERLEALERAHRELRATQDSLIRSEKLAGVGQLAAGVAHEVGNPLAAILGYTDLLRDGDLDAATSDDLLHRIQVQLERIQTIIRQLLDFSRSDATSDDLASPEPTNLGPCIEEALHLMSAHPSSRDIELRFEPAGKLPAVDATASGVVQVLVNLIVNACDAFGPDAGDDKEVCISVDTADPEYVVLRIHDNGPGIPEDQLSRVFDPFFTTKDPGQGTGLGLSICLRIMERFGGDIRVSSEAGEGTSVELLFNRSQFPGPQARAQEGTQDGAQVDGQSSVSS